MTFIMQVMLLQGIYSFLIGFKREKGKQEDGRDSREIYVLSFL